MVQLIRQLIQYRELLWSLVQRDLKARYKVAVLGFIWSLLRPLFTMVILYLVFSVVFRFEIDMNVPYPLYLLCALLPWGFHVTGVNNAANSLLHNANLIKKVKLPREVFPIAAIVAELINSLIAFIILFIFLVIFRIPVTVYLLWLPILLFIHFIFITGLGLATAALNVFFRDTSAILDAIMTAWFYLTPIFYPVSLAKQHLPEPFYQLFLLNPLVPLVTGYRKALLGNSYNTAVTFGPSFSEWLGFLGITSLVAITIFWLGIVIFRHFDSQFVDEL
ncbi:MAG: ABC transporter permease [bacterium]|nr:ABC transporter permease [bacterium]